MTIELYSAKWGELPVAQQFPNAPPGLILPGAHMHVVAAPDNRYHYVVQQFNIGQVVFLYYRFCSGEKETLTVITNQAVTFRFATHRSHRFTTRSFNMQLFHERSYNCFYLSHASMEYQLEAGDDFSFVDILIQTDYLQSLALPDDALQDFITKVNRKSAARLAQRNQVASIELLRWIDELGEWMATIDKPVETGEMIVRQLIKQSVCGLNNRMRKKPVKEKQEEVNRIYNAADIIKDNGDYYTKNKLPELAGMVGLSLYALKTRFEYIYGYSILKHQSEERMRQALRLVQTKRLSEKVVAEILGFSNKQSFSRKYKQRFGHSPYRIIQKE